ncbi:inhibitor of growth proteins N-terminal histone-binding-domain-containing protein [Cercophora scortea]|uniref:Chromatin modification-related protein n=1 Tax=Cercophora scortea TaxID=314031 RepID=A0AAE0J4Y7_9PEZI|nr:inhibitor of growth proteins N-terminal histone-binding-domain-containing protein [Cercophora scortea]
MPRDDLSIDFVRKMPPVEALDPALILDEWINRTQNLPEEIRFLQDEIADKDRTYDKLVKEIDERDARIQKYIKANGSHQPNPKEEEYRNTIRKNFLLAEKLANEKVALSQKLQQTMDKHIRHLDMQIKILYDRNEPGFSDPDELPSLLRPSAANITNTPVLRPVNATNPVTAALNTLANGTSQSSARSSSSQIRNAQSQQHASASAPATPAASMIMNRQARESSAGPGGGAPKRGPRSNSGLGNLPATSSGLARHSSLGPGTPKGHQTAAGIQRAGSAGPRATAKGAGGAANRKSGTPSSSTSRKKVAPGAGGGSTKSGLSRVKRAAKNSPSSAADSELSDADSGSADESDARTGGRGTPAAISRSSSNQAGGNANGNGNNTNPNNNGNNKEEAHHERESNTGPRIKSSGRRGAGDDEGMDDDDDAMDIDEDEAGDDKKYCMCQNVSYGDMVACDNEDCPFEWFHWSCVGLKSEPNGKWYCPSCTENMKKKS